MRMRITHLVGKMGGWGGGVVQGRKGGGIRYDGYF